MAVAHEIDYRIYGEEMQYVDVELDPGETAVAEAGAFMMMDDGIQMQTIFGDGSRSQGMGGGILDKLFSAGKRLLTGESLFMTAFTNIGQGKNYCTRFGRLWRKNRLPERFFFMCSPWG
jgi:uncharacterized protein (AIM24 family)